ncbi:MAG: RNA methyltransferase [Gammaproteobacteria bacterium]|nr:RNA methyltransferase [Gammaproteobacteria bacterium]
MHSNIKIILVEPQHPGNIGAVARAMKTMGLSRLVLIKPAAFPHKDAYIRATHAGDILDNCQINDELSEVIEDCHLVIGTSTRDRGGYVPPLTARQSAEKLVNEANRSTVALIFGTESTGLTGDDIRKCHYYAYIPTTVNFSSLNLAAAVQTFCYEIFQCTLESQADTDSRNENIFPANNDLEFFYKRFEDLLVQSNFINQKHPGVVMIRLKSVFKRARLDQKELNIFQGIISSLEKNRE